MVLVSELGIRILELFHCIRAVSSLPKHQSGFWVNVAMMVGTRSASECQEQHTCQQTLKVWRSRNKMARSKEEPGTCSGVYDRVSL